MEADITKTELECLSTIAMAAYYSRYQDVFYAIVKVMAEATKPWLMAA